jgi:hypothetical protein
MIKKTKSELDYALEYIDLLIKENHKYSLAEILVFWWFHKPNHKKLHLLNLKTLNTFQEWKNQFNKTKPLLDKQTTITKGNKNEKGNIINFDTTKLN